MRLKGNRLISMVLLAAMLIMSFMSGIVANAEAPTSLVFDFNDNTSPGWWGSANYVLTAENGELKIETNKANNSWASFGCNLGVVDITANPYVSIKVKANMDFMMNLSVFDVNDAYAYPKDDAVVTAYEVVASEYYTTYTFDFSGVGSKVDLSQIKMLNIVFNPGTPGVRGTVYFDDVKVGDSADFTPRMVNIPAQQTYINAPEQIVPIRGIADGTNGSHPVTITAESSNTELIPEVLVDYTGGSTGSLRYTPAPGKVGTSTITVTAAAEGTNADKVVIFDITVENNMAPKVDQVKNQVAKAGVTQQIRLTGIDDGNPNARQNLTVSAVSSNTELIPDPVIEYTSDNRYGILTYTPAEGQSGTATITVTVKDDGGLEAGGQDTGSMSFDVTIYRELNNAPVIDVPKDVSILENSGEYTVVLTGIGDGDEDVEQGLTLTAESDNPELINPIVEYTSGDSTAIVKFTPAADSVGIARITLTLTDDGGNENNNGDMSTSVTLYVQVRVAPVYGFADDFEDGILDPTWVGTGEGAHFSTETKDGDLGVMKIEVDKYLTNNKWAGLWYGIPQELDISENPYISIRMRTEAPFQNSDNTTDMLIFLWDAYDHYNTARTVTHKVTGEYVEYYFDFSDKLVQSDGTPVDPSRIKALLINFAPGAMYAGTFYFDDLRVGSEAHRPSNLPDIQMNGAPDFALDVNAGLQTVELTGINSGLTDPDGVILSAVSSNTELIPEITVSSVENGKATLSFAPAQDVSGSATVTVTASAEGANSKVITFKVDVLERDSAGAALINIDLATKFQEIDGFGAFMGTGQLSESAQDIYLRGAKDIGMSMARFGVIDESIEPANDNSNPYITDYEAFNYNALPLDFMRTLKEETDIDKYILTWWSPSNWMKRNKWHSADSWSTNNKLEPHYYLEYAEQIIATIKAVKEKTGIDLYAVSPQNEPEFNEPYASCVIRPDEYRDLIKVIGPRFKEEGITTKIFMPEGLWAQNNIDDYALAIINDPEARKYVDILAIHNYDADGINVGGAGADRWALTWQLAQQLPQGKKTWMTETSGHANNWNGAITLAANIYTALYYGNASGWVWWSFNDTPNSAAYGLMVNGEPTSRYAVSKHYYKFIQPGAVRVGAQSADNNVLTLAFSNPESKKLSIVLINRGNTSKLVKVQSESPMPSAFERYTTSNNRMFEQGADVTDGMVILPPSSITTLYGDLTNIDSEAPTAPTNLTCTDKTDSTVTLTWDPANDNIAVSGYDVYVDGIKVNLAKVVGTTYTVTGLQANTTYVFTVRAKDASGNESADSEACTVTTNPPPPGVVYEYWLNVGGSSVADIPVNTPPSGTQIIHSLEAPIDWADNYGSRIRGYIKPPISGEYTFYISSDDNSELWLSTDSDPENKQRIAYVASWTASRVWNKEANQKSAPISLNAGELYFFEVLHKEGGGGDNLAVGWTGPEISEITVIPGSFLEAYDAEPEPEDTEAPTAPANLRAVNITSNSVILAWDASTDNVGIKEYEVYNGETLVGKTSALSLAITGLIPETEYVFTVIAKDYADNASPASNPLTVTTLEEIIIPPDPTLLAYESFDAPVGALYGVNSGAGWSGGWNVQNSNVDVPGYNVSDAAGLTYKDLKTTPGYAIGGRSYLTSGRGLDISEDGAFKDYLTTDVPAGYRTEPYIGADGTTLWASFLLRKDTNNTGNQFVALHGSHVAWNTGEKPVVAAGYFGANSDKDGQKYWTLKIGADNYIMTDVPVVIGEAALFVVKMEFGDTTKVSLYVNPESIGGDAPAIPDATAETDACMVFRSVAFYGGSGTNEASVDEIRFGADYSVVTPSPTGGLSRGLVAHWAMDEGSGNVVRDTSGNGNDGTFTRGSAVWTEGVVGTGALAFDKTNEISVPDSESLDSIDATKKFSLSLWLKSEDPTDDWFGFLGRENFRLAVAGYNTSVHLLLGTGDDSLFTPNNSVTVGEWQHVAVTYDAVTAKIYLNGELKAQREYTLRDLAANTPFFIGGCGWGPGMKGELDDILLYNRVLTEDEIAALAEGYSPAPVVPADTTPPVITLDQSSGTVKAAEFTVSGSVDEPCVVKVNGSEVAVSTENTFATVITLAEGMNAITIEATDTAGNTSVVSIEVEYVPVGMSILFEKTIVRAGKEVQIVVKALGAADVKAFDFTLDYDAASFDIAGVTSHPDFGAQGENAYVDYVVRDGVARIVGISLAEDGFDGDVGLAVVTLRAKEDIDGAKTVKILSGAQLADSNAEMHTISGEFEAAITIADPDIDNDGRIAINDLTAVAECFMKRASDNDGYIAKYDMDKDGIIDLFDIVYIAKILLDESAS